MNCYFSPLLVIVIIKQESYRSYPFHLWIAGIFYLFENCDDAAHDADDANANVYVLILY